MLQLAIIGITAMVRDAVARRLRGVRLVGPDRLELADAVAWVGPAAPEREQVTAVLSSGRPVLLAYEGVLADPDLDQLFAHAATARVPLRVRSLERYRPSRRLIYEELRGPLLGAFGLIRVHRWEPTSGSLADPAALPHALVRDLDLVLWLTQALPTRAFALRRVAGATAQCLVQVHLGFANEGMALVDYTNGLPAGDGYQSLSVIGASGAVYADDHANQQLLYRGGRAQAEPTREGLLPLIQLVQEFALSASQPDGGDRMAWHRLRILTQTVRESIESGRAAGLEIPQP